LADKLCFLVGPIGKDGSSERKHADLLLHLIVKHVLEAKEFGYTVRRSDEDADPGMIGDRVISDVIHAVLVVADLTDLNPNVFYELGIRHSTVKPVIHVAKFGTKLPFDTASHRTIFVDLADWHSIVECRERLANSARSIEDPGFSVSNPITQANASFNMRASADPRDRVISNLTEKIDVLSARLAQVEVSAVMAYPPFPFPLTSMNSLRDLAGIGSKAWVRDLNGRAAVLVADQDNEQSGMVTISVGSLRRRMTKEEWEKLPLWTGPFP
jgi:hypothetical protein